MRARRGVTLIRGTLITLVLVVVSWWALMISAVLAASPATRSMGLAGFTLDWLRSTTASDSAKRLLGVVVIYAAAPRVVRWVVDRDLRSLDQERTARARRARRRTRVSRGLYAAVGVALTALLASSLALAAGWRGVLIGVLFQAPIHAGLMIGLGLFASAGTRLCCARCGYRMVSWRQAPDRCPECGAAWKGPWGAAAGGAKRGWSWVAAGAALYALSAVIVSIAAFTIL